MTFTFKPTAIATLLAAAMSLPALAEQAPPAAPPAPGHNMGGGGMGGMGGGMSEEMKEQQLKQKQDFFLKMYELSGKILGAKDDQERNKLKAEQLQLMKDQENTARQMMQQHMQQMMGGMKHGAGGGAPGGMGGGMGGMQHGTPPAAPAGGEPAAPAH